MTFQENNIFSTSLYKYMAQSEGNLGHHQSLIVGNFKCQVRELETGLR